MPHIDMIQTMSQETQEQKCTYKLEFSTRGESKQGTNSSKNGCWQSIVREEYLNPHNVSEIAS